MKILDNTGLACLWTKIKSLLRSADGNHYIIVTSGGARMSAVGGSLQSDVFVSSASDGSEVDAQMVAGNNRFRVRASDGFSLSTDGGTNYSPLESGGDTSNLVPNVDGYYATFAAFWAAFETAAPTYPSAFFRMEDTAGWGPKAVANVWYQGFAVWQNYSGGSNGISGTIFITSGYGIQYIGIVTGTSTPAVAWKTMYGVGTSTADARANLGAAAKWQTLWTNGSPTSDFAAQTVTLSQNVSSFNKFKILYIWSPDHESLSTDLMYLYSGVYYGYLLAAYNSAGTVYTYGRAVHLSGTSAVFATCYRGYSGSNVSDNSYMIPYKILATSV